MPVPRLPETLMPWCAITVSMLAVVASPSTTAATALSPGRITVGCPFVGSDASQRNANYVDTKAYYATAQVPLSLPDGASIRIEGRFARTRYFSLQAYDGVKTGNFIDSLPDARIAPTTGGALNTNPAALPDSAGYTNRFVVTLRYADPPATASEREPNTLYMGAARDTSSPTRVSRQILYRTYLPNPGSDISGDTPPPELIYSGPSGEINFRDTPDAARCRRINTLSGRGGAVSVALLPQRSVAFTPVSHTRDFVPYPNGDTNYLRAQVSRLYAPIVVVRAKRFRVPSLPDEIPRDAKADVRYWSFCQYHDTTGAAIACKADREFVTQADGYNLIVVSSAADRPPLATEGAGYNWLDTAGATNVELLLRQLLARPGFSGDYALAAARSSEPLKTTLGGWAPQISYCDQATFAATASSGGKALIAACDAAFFQPLGSRLPLFP